MFLGGEKIESQKWEMNHMISGCLATEKNGNRWVLPIGWMWVIRAKVYASCARGVEERVTIERMGKTDHFSAIESL